MNAGDVFIWIVIGGAIALVLGFAAWSLFRMIKVADDISEEEWNKYCRDDEIKLQQAAGDFELQQAAGHNRSK